MLRQPTHYPPVPDWPGAAPATRGDGAPGAEAAVASRQAPDGALASAPTAIGGERRLFYTLKEAAALLHISPETYYRGVREGRFPGRKVGGQWRVPCGALHRYAEGESVAS